MNDQKPPRYVPTEESPYIDVRQRRGGKEEGIIFSMGPALNTEEDYVYVGE